MLSLSSASSETDPSAAPALPQAGKFAWVMIEAPFVLVDGR
ncbi:hypothetical protein SAMCFNEI73_pC1711 (plasmid) [Sinorhizobium americanum]|uniref:Uncharacterized protein n=1 Tax=Sinorhizobium americanum TaxID=194963 RepID=A0A1L3LZ85_9HYPH|nr:hypothetical protein SAMCFNEI73_pC1711 [Sinorhizobium americanum]